MLFQTLDDYKKECLAFYSDNGFTFNLSEEYTHTWAYRSYLPESTEFIKLYTNGKTLSDVCPTHMKDEWAHVNNKMIGHIKAISTAGILLNENCILDLIPSSFLIKYLFYKNEICKHVLDNYPRPENYDFRLNLEILLSEISSRELKNSLHPGRHIVYNAHSSTTGRLTVMNDSFPILNINTNSRYLIRPTNGIFLELDFNAADLRTFLSLAGHEQPTEDIHMWNDKNFFNNIGRKESKKLIFTWLYDHNNKNNSLEAIYDRKKIINKYYDGCTVITPYGRVIQAPQRKALSYIIQSTSNDIFLTQAFKINKYLKSKRSFISFLMHDSIMIDLHPSEIDILNDVKGLFQDTEYGKFKINVKVGMNYGDMRVKA